MIFHLLLTTLSLICLNVLNYYPIANNITSFADICKFGIYTLPIQLLLFIGLLYSITFIYTTEHSIWIVILWMSILGGVAKLISGYVYYGSNISNSEMIGIVVMFVGILISKYGDGIFGR